MNLIIDTLEKMKKEEGEGFITEVIVGPRSKYQKEKILESIRKIKKSGNKVRLKYVKNLYRYYSILKNLGYLVRSHPILIEKKVKYHCEDFYHYLDDKVDDSSERIITAIIIAVANDEPLDSFYKYLMFPKFYKEEYEIDQKNISQVKDDDTSKEEN